MSLRTKILIATGLVLVCGVALVLRPAKAGFTVSPETTKLTEPLRKNGTVDYIAALNATASEGVTDDENAFIPLGMAFLPDSRSCRRSLEHLGITEESLDAEHEGFIPIESVIEVLYPESKFSQRFEIEAAEKSALQGPVGSGEGFPVHTEWLSQNARILELIRTAGSRPKYFAPIVAHSGVEYDLSSGVNVDCKFVRALSELLSASALVRIHERDFDGALHDVNCGMKLLRMIQESPRTALAVPGHDRASRKLLLAARAVMAAIHAQSDRRKTPLELPEALSDPDRRLSESLLLVRLQLLDHMVCGLGVSDGFRMDGWISRDFEDLSHYGGISVDQLLWRINEAFDRVDEIIREPDRSTRYAAFRALPTDPRVFTAHHPGRRSRKG